MQHPFWTRSDTHYHLIIGDDGEPTGEVECLGCLRSAWDIDDIQHLDGCPNTKASEYELAWKVYCMGHPANGGCGDQFVTVEMPRRPDVYPAAARARELARQHEAEYPDHEVHLQPIERERAATALSDGEYRGYVEQALAGLALGSDGHAGCDGCGAGLVVGDGVGVEAYRRLEEGRWYVTQSYCAGCCPGGVCPGPPGEERALVSGVVGELAVAGRAWLVVVEPDCECLHRAQVDPET